MREITSHRVEGDLPQNQLAITVVDGPGAGGANHHYEIDAKEGDIAGLCRIRFQKGGIAEAGINGVTHEALLAILIDRLECFQRGPYPSDYNATALFHLQRALEALHKRTKDRLARGVEGKSAA